MFALEYSVDVEQRSADRGKKSAGPRKGPLSIAHDAVVSISMQVPADAFEVEEDMAEVLRWNGTYDTAQFEVTCLRGAELRSHICKAFISVGGERKAILLFE